MSLPRPKEGDLLSAAAWAEYADALEAALGLSADAASGLESSRIGGRLTLRGRSGPPEIWAKITGAPSGSLYPWAQQLEASAGAWATGPRAGTTSANPLREANGNTAVPVNTLVRAWKDRFGWWFLYSACS